MQARTLVHEEHRVPHRKRVHGRRDVHAEWTVPRVAEGGVLERERRAGERAQRGVLWWWEARAARGQPRRAARTRFGRAGEVDGW